MTANQVQIEHIACDFCGSKNHSKHDSIDEWKIVRCKDCGFLFTNPRPTISSLPHFYSEEYFKDERHFSGYYNKDGSPKIGNPLDYQNRILDIENYRDTRGRLLEVGAARGDFLHVMRNRGWQVHGVEISHDAVRIARDHYKLGMFEGVLQDFQPNEKFDAICMYQTLEHVPDPKEVLVKSWELLNSGGILVVEIPNLSGFDIKFKSHKKKMIYDLPRHLNHFKPDFLEREVKKLGFDILEVDKYYPDFLLKLISLREKSRGANNNDKPSSHVQNTPSSEPTMLKKATGMKLSLIKSFSENFQGWRFTITAQKP